ncbi:TonB-dependent receptor [Caulobacter sp. D4A]|uniref:outer membrane beta-barrel protein n=1 Tax=unclassified Caulobacter TaxID=2648921 RepID=UPI000D730CF5|nr:MULTISPECIES: outer membrane beta-barrel protein [unclassified Caulobacter]PXA85776.1 TonB-dependent receptor [Caulobacter sp. D5]PXA90824.1 TonB-dependent receptor [Caulobacter sp. D4A]
MRSLHSVLTCGAAVCALSIAMPAQAQERVFDIPAQPAVRAIPELARQGQVQIIAPARGLEGVRTPAVKGRMDVRTALARLIAGTPLRIDSDDGQIITLRAEGQGGARPSAGAGVVRGRVLNTVTGEFVRNAEVRVAGTPIVAYTEAGGDFRLVGVPAGDLTVVVKYAGLQEARAAVNVAPGQISALNFELTAYAAAGDEVEAITITAKRDGVASAIMERRASTNAKNVVAADNFGALTMGDVGEFMKNMPGLSLDYTEVDASAVRIGGLDPKYSTFTTDGARMATATSNNNAGRQNSFEQMSITGVDSIELNNTLTASMDADSPGGAINLRSKYAFQRNGRLLRFQVGGVGTSDSGTTRIYFPDDEKHARIFPSAQIGYGDVFLDGRLGIAFNASYNANYVQQDRIQTDWSYLANGRVMPYQVMWRPGPKLTHRQAANLSVDYKITDKLAFSLRSNYSFYDVEYFNQYTYLIFGTSTTSQTTADSTPTHIVVNPNGTNTRLHTQYSHRYAGTPSWLVAPKLEYRGDTWEAVLRGSYAASEFNFRDNSKGFFQRTDSYLTRIGFTLDRASEDSNVWTLKQTAGRSWSDPTSFNRDDDIGNNIRTAESDAKNNMYGAYFDVKKRLEVGVVPVTLLAGFGGRSNDWRTNEGSYQQFQYVGPTGDLTQKAPEAVIPWTQGYQFKILGFDAGNMNAQGWRADSNYGVYDIYAAHPEYFVADTVGNLKRRLDNNKRIQEDITSAYFEVQPRYGRAKFDLGLRYEKTETAARVADIRPAKEVTAAGLSTSTVAGLLYQYHNGVYTTRHGEYDDWFLSGGAKYEFTKRLVGQLAFSQSILRPDYANLGGVVAVDDNNLIVTVPNPLLKPEHSTKYYAGLQYFLEPSGVVGVSVYQLDIKDMQVTGMTVDPEDVGYSAGDYVGYTFRSAQNLPGTSTNKGLTLEYDQQLTFLPGMLRGFGLRGSVTRVDPDGERVNMPKVSANWGLRYSYGPFDFQLTGNSQSKYRTSALSNTPTTAANGILYHAPRELWNISASYKINKQFEVMLAGRNIFNAPDVVYSNIPSRVQQYSIYGSMWNIGVKGSF